MNDEVERVLTDPISGHPRVAVPSGTDRSKNRTPTLRSKTPPTNRGVQPAQGRITPSRPGAPPPGMCELRLIFLLKLFRICCKLHHL